MKHCTSWVCVYEICAAVGTDCAIRVRYQNACRFKKVLSILRYGYRYNSREIIAHSPGFDMLGTSPLLS
jgi:hypothetical protein